MTFENLRKRVSDIVSGTSPAPPPNDTFVLNSFLDAQLSKKADIANLNDFLKSTATAIALRNDLTILAADYRAYKAKSPFEFMPNDAVKTAIRTGINPPSANSYLLAMIDDMITNANDFGGYCEIPDGTWIFDRAVQSYIHSLGKTNRRFEIRFSPGAKLVSSPLNKFRFVRAGAWDAAGNPNLINSGTGSVGDFWTVVSYNGALNLDGITNVNVGDQIYKSASGWRKILCRANYMTQFWNAATNTDSEGNLVVLPGRGDEYDCYIVGVAGAANIDGNNDWQLGDEIIYLEGLWRRKRVQGGNFRGTWNPAINAQGLSNANGQAGDWYIVGGNIAFAPISLGSGKKTGLGEAITFCPGEKIWCVEPGRWEKVYASPTFRGEWFADSDTRHQQWYPNAIPAGHVGENVGIEPVLDRLLSGKGGYGSTYECTREGTQTVGSITRNWKRGEFIHFGSNGPEVIYRDPGYDYGFFLFWQDDKTSLRCSGTITIVPRTRKDQFIGFSEGVLFRNYSIYRADYANYLYQGPMLDVADLVYMADDPDAGLAQGHFGLFEGIWEVKNLYIPIFRHIDGLSTNPGGVVKVSEERQYPRLNRYAIRHIDSYVPNHHSFGWNGGVLWGITCESDVWSPEQLSFEGGNALVKGTNMMTAIRVAHNLRQTPGSYEPTFEIEFGDVAFCRYGAHIKGHSGINIKVGNPILPGTGGSDKMISQPAFIFLEGVAHVRISDGIPTAGFYADSESFTTFLKTRAGVHDVAMTDISFQDMRGVITCLQHNGNKGQPFNMGFVGKKKEIHIYGCTGWEPSGDLKLYYENSNSSKTLSVGPAEFRYALFAGGAAFSSPVNVGHGDNGNSEFNIGVGKVADGADILSFMGVNAALRAQIVRNAGENGSLQVKQYGTNGQGGYEFIYNGNIVARITPGGKLQLLSVLEQNVIF